MGRDRIGWNEMDRMRSGRDGVGLEGQDHMTKAA